jgi:hypothetical protein
MTLNVFTSLKGLVTSGDWTFKWSYWTLHRGWSRKGHLATWRNIHVETEAARGEGSPRNKIANQRVAPRSAISYSLLLLLLIGYLSIEVIFRDGLNHD